MTPESGGDGASTGEPPRPTHRGPANLESIEALHGAMDGGGLGRGDVVYVSPSLYAAMSDAARAALWDRVLGMHAMLVTGLPTTHGVEISRTTTRAEPRGKDGRDAT